MSNNLVKIKLHGTLGQSVGEDWDISVSSVPEAMRAIEVLSGRKLYKFLLDNDKNNIRYQVLVNKSIVKKTFDESDVNQIKNSELMISLGHLNTIDIVPVIEGAGDGLDFLNVFLGATLMILAFYGGPVFGPTLFMAGLGLLANGISNLLAKPPDMEPFREIQGSRQSVSYLFNGPENTIYEGGPVPVGYGRLMIGSQSISTNYVISRKAVDDTTAGANKASLPDSSFMPAAARSSLNVF